MGGGWSTARQHLWKEVFPNSWWEGRIHRCGPKARPHPLRGIKPLKQGRIPSSEPGPSLPALPMGKRPPARASLLPSPITGTAAVVPPPPTCLSSIPPVLFALFAASGEVGGRAKGPPQLNPLHRNHIPRKRWGRHVWPAASPPPRNVLPWGKKAVGGGSHLRDPAPSTWKLSWAEREPTGSPVRELGLPAEC